MGITQVRSGLSTSWTDGVKLIAGSLNEISREVNLGLSHVWSDFVANGSNADETYTMPSGTVTTEIIVFAWANCSTPGYSSDVHSNDMVITIAGGSEIEGGITASWKGEDDDDTTDVNATTLHTCSRATGLDWSGTDIDIVANVTQDTPSITYEGMLILGR